MRILQRYVITEFLANFFIAVTIFTGFMFLANLLRPLRDGLTILQVGRFMHLYVPYVLTWSIPLSILTAAVISSAKLAETGELTAIQSSGIHVSQIFSPVILLALVLCGLTFYANASVIPNCRMLLKGTRDQMLFEIIKSRLERYGEKEIKITPYKLYVGSVQGGRLLSVAISTELKSGDVLVLHAKEASFSDDQENSMKLLMKDGSTIIIERPADSSDNSPATPPREWTWKKNLMTVTPRSDKNPMNKPRDMTLWSLLDRVRKHLFAKPEARRDNREVIEVHNRFSLSAVCFLFTFLGIPLGMLSRKSNRLVGFALSILLAIGIYYPLHMMATFLAKKNILAPWISLWSPNVIFLFVGGFLWWLFMRA